MARIVNRTNDPNVLEKAKNLYKYNAPIEEILEAAENDSGLNVVDYIAQIDTGVKYYREVLNSLKSKSFVGFVHLGTQDVCRSQLNGHVFHFSVIEVIDRRNVEFISQDALTKTYDLLRRYIETKMYPLIAMPVGSDEVITTFEKYDAVRHEEVIGTIVDVFNDNGHIFTTVMWSKEYVETYDAKMYRSFAGTISLVNMIPTPSEWKNDDDNAPFGIPIFEMYPVDYTLMMLREVHPLRDRLNDSVSTGDIQLNFVNFLEEKIKTCDEVYKMFDSNPPVGEPENISVDDIDDDVARMAHLVRLYGGNDDPEEKCSLTRIMREETEDDTTD